MYYVVRTGLHACTCQYSCRYVCETYVYINQVLVNLVRSAECYPDQVSFSLACALARTVAHALWESLLSCSLARFRSIAVRINCGLHVQLMLPPPGFDFPSKNSGEPETEIGSTPQKDAPGPPQRGRGGSVGLGRGQELVGEAVLEDRGTEYC